MTDSNLNSHLTNRIQGQNLTLGYDNTPICQQLDIAIPDGKFSVIIGPNGCGKSTLLRSLCRLLTPIKGEIHFDGQPLHKLPSKEVAKQIGLLPQTAQAPDGIRVVDLVARGRFPHQNLFRQWSEEDQHFVTEAMQAAGVEELAEKQVSQLSGGQRQRVWIAMVLAQNTDILFLDEPTTYLDIAHQVELLDLFKRLNRKEGRTVVAVLHDLNQACRYADHLIVLANGKKVTEGEPEKLMTPELVMDVFGLNCQIMPDPISHTPMIIPIGAWD